MKFAAGRLLVWVKDQAIRLWDGHQNWEFCAPFFCSLQSVKLTLLVSSCRGSDIRSLRCWGPVVLSSAARKCACTMLIYLLLRFCWMLGRRVPKRHIWAICFFRPRLRCCMVSVLVILLKLGTLPSFRVTDGRTNKHTTTAYTALA